VEFAVTVDRDAIEGSTTVGSIWSSVSSIAYGYIVVALALLRNLVGDDDKSAQVNV